MPKSGSCVSRATSGCVADANEPPRQRCGPCGPATGTRVRRIFASGWNDRPDRSDRLHHTHRARRRAAPAAIRRACACTPEGGTNLAWWNTTAGLRFSALHDLPATPVRRRRIRRAARGAEDAARCTSIYCCASATPRPAPRGLPSEGPALPAPRTRHRAGLRPRDRRQARAARPRLVLRQVRQQDCRRPSRHAVGRQAHRRSHHRQRPLPAMERIETLGPHDGAGSCSASGLGSKNGATSPEPSGAPQPPLRRRRRPRRPEGAPLLIPIRTATQTTTGRPAGPDALLVQLTLRGGPQEERHRRRNC